MPPRVAKCSLIAPTCLKYGDRIAQFIIEKITETEIEEVDDLDDTLRGEGGFGSTGVSNNSTEGQSVSSENGISK